MIGVAVILLVSMAQPATAPPQSQPSGQANTNCPLGSAVVRIRVKDYNDMAASVIQSSDNFLLDSDAEQQALGKILDSQASDKDADQKPQTFRVTFFSPDCSQTSWPFKLKPFQKVPFTAQIEELAS